MLSVAKLKYLQISPRKVRLVADLIRGKKVEEVQVILNFTRKRAVLPILKLLQQAVANAKSKDLKLEEKDIYISEIFVDGGPRSKRVFPRARGKADTIYKRTSHITIILDMIGKGKGGKKAKITTKPLKADKSHKSSLKAEVKTKAELRGKERETEKGIRQPAEKTEESKKTKERMKWKPETKRLKQKSQRGIKRFFRRKAI